MKGSARSVALMLVVAAFAFGAGWFIRGRRAGLDEASRDRFDVLMKAFESASSDRFVLVMIDKKRTEELPSLLERRLAEGLSSTRKLLTEAPQSTSSLLKLQPWAAALLPNLANEFRRSGEYLARNGKYPQAVQDAEWLAKQVEALDAS